MFENGSQQSNAEVNARTEKSQNSSHEQTCFLLKKPVESQYSSSSLEKNRKNSKHQNKIAVCEQKDNNEKASFCSNSIFSIYYKFRAKKCYAPKPLAF